MRIHLHKLDEFTATFRDSSEDLNVALTMARFMWEEEGRPTSVYLDLNA